MRSWPVVIVGGGPVGLFLGCRLSQLGIPFALFDDGASADRASRAIGLLPPGLRGMAALSLLEPIRRRGVVIRGAQAWTGRRRLGRLSISSAPGPIPFAVSLPQPETERLLATELQRRIDERADGSMFFPRHRVVDMTLDASHATLTVRFPGDHHERVRARWLVGGDGRESAVRRRMSVLEVGTTRPESYLMGDFADDTCFGTDAAFLLTDEGLVESFPLPAGKRRWVVEAPSSRRVARAGEIARLVYRRTGRSVRDETATWTSAFGVEQRMALQLRRGPAIVVGDAAHVVSPFGAQGMNLGWLGAWRLASALAAIVSRDEPARERLREYAQQQRRDARRAMWRGALNGLVGRRKRFPALRNVSVEAALRWVPEPWLARLFTMAPLFGPAAQPVAAPGW